MRLSKIDPSNIEDHHYIVDDDQCFYLMEKTSGKDYSFSKANSIISNIKKKPSQKGRPGYHYKGTDISLCAELLAGALNPRWLDNATLVPVPSSKAKDHPDHDDRMLRICKGIGADVDVRELVIQNCSTEAAHESGGARLSPDDLLKIYELDRTLVDPAPTSIGIVDDMLTAGSHFRAMHSILSDRYPNVPITGLFIARRAFPTSDLTEGS